MTGTFRDGHPKVLPACNLLSQYYFYNIFLQKSCRFSLQTLAKFEATKTGSGVGFLRLTAVWLKSICSQSLRYPCPADRGNEGSGNEIGAQVIMAMQAAKLQWFAMVGNSGGL